MSSAIEAIEHAPQKIVTTEAPVEKGSRRLSFSFDRLKNSTRFGTWLEVGVYTIGAGLIGLGVSGAFHTAFDPQFVPFNIENFKKIAPEVGIASGLGALVGYFFAKYRPGSIPS